MNRIQQLFSDEFIMRRFSRRRFVATSAAAGLGLLVVACGGDDDDDDAPTPTTAAPAATATTGGGAAEPTATTAASEPTATSGDSPEPTATVAAEPTPTIAGTGEDPVPGGIFAAALSSPPPNFDLHQNSSFVVCQPMMPCYSLLARYDVKDSSVLLPDLAEAWETSDDGLMVTFFLRQGVKFHNGKDFKSEDVKISFDRIISPPEGVTSPRRSVFATVDSIEETDEYTATFNLSQPTASLLTNIGQGWMAVYPKDVLEEKGDMKADVVGTGPFKLKSYTEGVSLELERNPDYFLAGQPYLDGLLFYVIPDANAQISAFVSGQLSQIIVDLPGDAESIVNQMGNDKVTSEEYFTTSNYVLEMNAEREPWGDTRVRQAANLAIDRTSALAFLNDGRGQVTGVMVPGGVWALPEEEIITMPGYSNDPSAKEADFEQARALLAEAGYADGITGNMLVRQGEDFEKVAIFLQDQLSKVGIMANLEVFETATFYEKQDAREFDLFGGSYSIAVDDPDGAYGSSYVCGAGRNYSNLCVDEFEELFNAQSQEPDMAKRQAIVADMERMILGDAMKAVLGFRVNFQVRDIRVQNYRRNYSQYITEQHIDTWFKP